MNTRLMLHHRCVRHMIQLHWNLRKSNKSSSNHRTPKTPSVWNAIFAPSNYITNNNPFFFMSSPLVNLPLRQRILQTRLQQLIIDKVDQLACHSVPEDPSLLHLWYPMIWNPTPWNRFVNWSPPSRLITTTISISLTTCPMRYKPWCIQSLLIYRCSQSHWRHLKQKAAKYRHIGGLDPDSWLDKAEVTLHMVENSKGLNILPRTSTGSQYSSFISTAIEKVTDVKSSEEIILLLKWRLQQGL